MDITDFETDLLLFAKEQGIDVNAVNFILNFSKHEDKIASCAHYLGFRTIEEDIKPLCPEAEHEGKQCLLNSGGKWISYSNGDEKLFENINIIWAHTPIITPFGILVRHAGQRAIGAYYQGTSLNDRLALKYVPTGCPNHPDLCRLVAPYFVQQVLDEATGKLTDEQKELVQNYMLKQLHELVE